MLLLDKEKIITEIKHELVSKFQNGEILSAFVYGSTLGEDFCETSDFDILVIFNESNIENLEKLRFLKKMFSEKDILVDFNVHDKNDLPSNRMEAFWHNNRGIYLRREIELHGRTIIGENVLVIKDIDHTLLCLEVVRVLNSLVYQARKYIINQSLERKNIIQILKWCIYAVQYSLAYKNIFPTSKREAMRIFRETFNTTTNPEKFLDLKVRGGEININNIKDAYHFLCEIDTIVLEDWKMNKKETPHHTHF